MQMCGRQLTPEIEQLLEAQEDAASPWRTRNSRRVAHFMPSEVGASRRLHLFWCGRESAGGRRMRRGWGHSYKRTSFLLPTNESRQTVSWASGARFLRGWRVLHVERGGRAVGVRQREP